MPAIRKMREEMAANLGEGWSWERTCGSGHEMYVHTSGAKVSVSRGMGGCNALNARTLARRALREAEERARSNSIPDTVPIG